MDDVELDCDCDLLEATEEQETDVPELDAALYAKDLAAVAISANKYAPLMPPVKGNINLYAVALKWMNDSGASLGSVSSAAHQMAKIYKELSGGLINFKVIAKQVSVDYNKSAKNVPKAEQQAKRKLNAPANERNIYAIVNHGAKGFSNAGGNTAHLRGTLTRDFCHEVGHLRPFSLGHSGRYVDGKLEAYGDGTSFMGRFASTKLTGAQLYLLGWLPQNKVGLYELDDPATDFNICSLFADNSKDGVKVVLIPRGQQRPLYLSMPQINGKPTLCLHLSSGRGTQRVAVFGNQATYEGVNFVKIADADGYVVVRVSTAQD